MDSTSSSFTNTNSNEQNQVLMNNQMNINLIQNTGEQVQPQTNPNLLNAQQQEQNAVKLTPEQEEEIKLRIKYPNPQKPGGSAFIQKMLHKGSKKYFDSGDYNMAKSKMKANAAKTINNQQNTNLNTNTTVTSTSMVTNQNSLTNTSTSEITPQSPNEFNSPTVVLIDSQSATPPNTINVSSLNANETIISTNLTNIGNTCLSSSVNTTPIAVNNNNINNNNCNQLDNSTNMIVNTSNSLSPLSSSNNLNSINNQLVINNTGDSSNYLSLSNNQQQQHITSSVSTNSLAMLSSSISTDKLSNIQINNPLLDEEIGHAIPTPECLPQSRKHSIVQSKLATPRLSSS